MTAAKARVGALVASTALTAALVGHGSPANAADVQSQQWYLNSMNAEGLWKVSTGRGITVAVVDSGVGKTPGLQGKLLAGEDVTGTPGGPNDDFNGHGTTMAELIAGSGEGGGIRGLAPDAKILPLRKSAKGYGADSGDSHKAIRVAADSEARIINLSFGGPEWYQSLEDSIRYAISKGKLVFAAVGNSGDGENKKEYPAGLHGVVGVGASDKDGKVEKYSQHGNYIDLAAPSGQLPGYCDKSLTKYCTSSGGTSSATAITSAAAALIWSKHPDWTANQVLRVLIDTAGRDWPKDNPSIYLGYGLIRPARNILKNQGNPGPANIDPISGKSTIAEPSKPVGSPEPSAAEGSSEGSAKPSVNPEAANASSSSGDSGKYWLIGIAAAGVLALGVAVVARQRRGV
ncbi:S8 family serine peptidase [Streptomyces sp. NA04227]|uniref:S8 family serine peptidase n=1 Tax=Streptomyces sp. NA04227 TaxID=2742136 RepID=UPI001592ABAF|nr:S8 family serine peptidase [Streptomyces sp. NA04227]QKW09513.1 S8 family serine peptidase [Streptomyces sp. NA04227]